MPTPTAGAQPMTRGAEHPVLPTRPLVLAAPDSFSYPPEWLRASMTHLAQSRFGSVRRELTAHGEYALVWRGVHSVAGLYSRLGATVPARVRIGLFTRIPARHTLNRRARKASAAPLQGIR
jgi:hypothetical protein